jgi:probable HAF family extracellular repeat protein
LIVEQLEGRRLLTTYSLTDLGTLGGGIAYPLDINEAGQVAGYSSTAAGQQHAFLWEDGVMTDLGTLGGAHSSAGGLNDVGQLVGSSRVDAGTFVTDAFTWESGVMTGLGILKQASAAEINNAGQVVGAYTRDPVPPSGSSVRWAFLWEDGVLRSLFEGSAADINGLGQVAGEWESTRGYPVAAVWDATLGPRELGVLPGGVFSAAYGINDAGQVVGWSESFGGNHAFLWDDGQMIDLGFGTAADINNAGQIVGWSNIWTDGVKQNLNDLVLEDFGLTISNASAINDAGQIVATAYDAQNRPHAVLLNPLPENTPVVSIDDASVSEGHSGTRTITFTVSLSAASSEPVTVNFATANGTAIAGSDYQAGSGVMTFAPGQSTATITLLVNGDRVGEPNETFVINLSGATGGAVITDGQGIGTIIDDEPRLSINDVTMLEGQSGTRLFVFSVSLSSSSSAPVTVNFTTANGTAKASEDYNATSGALTFAPGETTKTITVVVKGDRKREADETFFLNLTGAVGAVIQDGQGKGTIRNDD